MCLHKVWWPQVQIIAEENWYCKLGMVSPTGYRDKSINHCDNSLGFALLLIPLFLNKLTNMQHWDGKSCRDKLINLYDNSFGFALSLFPLFLHKLNKVAIIFPFFLHFSKFQPKHKSSATNWVTISTISSEYHGYYYSTVWHSTSRLHKNHFSWVVSSLLVLSFMGPCQWVHWSWPMMMCIQYCDQFSVSPTKWLYFWMIITDPKHGTNHNHY